MFFSQAHQSLAAIVASYSRLDRRFKNLVRQVVHLAQRFAPRRKNTMSHLHFVLHQTSRNKRPGFARYPTLGSKVVLICDPYVWPSLARKAVRTLLSPKEIWNLLGRGPLVAPLPYLLSLFFFFCILNNAKVKSVKQRTWTIAACVWIFSMTTLMFAEQTEYGKYVFDALLAGLALWVDYLPSLKSLDRSMERASQAVGLPLKYLPSWLFFINIGYHVFLICRDVYLDWQNPEPRSAETGQRQETLQPQGAKTGPRQPTPLPNQGDAHRQVLQNVPQVVVPFANQQPAVDFRQGRAEFHDGMRRHFSTIRQRLEETNVHYANMHRILDDWEEADRQHELDNASSASNLQSEETLGNGSDTERDTELDDLLENMQPSAEDSQSLNDSAEAQASADQPSEELVDASDMEEGNAERRQSSAEHQQPTADCSQSPASPVKGVALVDQLLQKFGVESAIEREDDEQSPRSFEHRPSVGIDFSPTDAFDGPSLQDELGQLGHESGSGEESEEDEENDNLGDGGSNIAIDHGGDDDDQSLPVAAFQTAESSKRTDNHEDEEQDSPQIISYQTADDSYIEDSHADGEHQSSLDSTQGETSFRSADDLPGGEQQSTQTFHRPAVQLEDYRTQPRQRFDLADLENAQFFSNERDYHAVADEMPEFLESEFWNPQEEQEDEEQRAQTSGAGALTRIAEDQGGEEPQAQMSRGVELTRMAREQFGDEFVTYGEIEDFRREGQNEAPDDLPPDHVKMLAEAQYSTAEGDEHEGLRQFRDFMMESEAEQRARQQVATDRTEELKAFHEGQAFVDDGDQQHTQRSLDRFVEEGEAEQQAQQVQQASQPDLQTLSNAQSFVADDEVAQTARDVEGFVEEGRARAAGGAAGAGTAT